MAAKAILVLCAQAFLIQCTISQYVNPAAVDGPVIIVPLSQARPYDGLPLDSVPYDVLGYPNLNALQSVISISPGMEVTPSAGGLLPVTSTSAIPPIGISVICDNAYEGLLAVAGEVPFVGTTGMEGVLPTGGAGAIDHGCGDEVAMVSEVAPAALVSAIGGPSLIPAVAPGGIFCGF